MKKFLSFLSNLCVSSFPLVCFCLIVSNVIVSCSVVRSCHPRYFYKSFVFTNEVLSVVTQFNGFVSSPFSFSSSSSSSSSSDTLQSSFPVQYDYFVLSGSPCIRLFGRVYHEGDHTSRGMILRIFPDKVFLFNGSVLLNTSFSESRPNRLDSR